MKYLRSRHLFTSYVRVLLESTSPRPPVLRNVAGSARACLLSSHVLKISISPNRNQPCCYSTTSAGMTENNYSLSDDACPQGIQGYDCAIVKLWLENCRRYGLKTCNNEGVQTGRKTVAEVIADQDTLIIEIADQYQTASDKRSRRMNSQGVQASVADTMDLDWPCPQGVQGQDCAQFKLWLENCHRWGLHNCAQQFGKIKAGRKTLAEIFVEQEKTIHDTASLAFLKTPKRSYSTSSKSPTPNSEDKPGNEDQTKEVQLTQREKLKRAVKEYGSTVIVFHVTISLMSLGFFYLLVSSGIDVVGLLMKLGIGGTLLQNKLAAGTGTFVVAYAVHKVFAPVRIATTLTATPFIVRYLRRIGFLKAPQPSSSK